RFLFRHGPEVARGARALQAPCTCGYGGKEGDVISEASEISWPGSGRRAAGWRPTGRRGSAPAVTLSASPYPFQHPNLVRLSCIWTRRQRDDSWISVEDRGYAEDLVPQGVPDAPRR